MSGNISEVVNCNRCRFPYELNQIGKAFACPICGAVHFLKEGVIHRLVSIGEKINVIDKAWVPQKRWTDVEINHGIAALLITTGFISIFLSLLLDKAGTIAFAILIFVFAAMFLSLYFSWRRGKVVIENYHPPEDSKSTSKTDKTYQ